MEISLPVAERTTTKTITKYATDSSVSITADHSSRYVNYDASGTSAPFTPYIQGETTEDRSSLFTLAPQADKYLYFSIPTQYTGWDIELSNSSFELIDAEIREDMNQLQVHIRNTDSSRVQSGTVTVVWALVTGWYSPTPIDIPLDAPAVDGIAYQNGYSYEIVGAVTLSVGSGSSYSISDDGATLTVNGWATTEGYPSGNKISASCTVAVERRYVSGYSGYASVAIDDTDPYDIEVDSLTSGVTAGTPSYSGGRIVCWLYANYERTASVTFSYKVDSTVTEKYFNINVNGEDIEEVNFNDVDLDPNA